LRILVVGLGVIGSVYASKLLQKGHEVVPFARGRRLEDLQTYGLITEHAKTGQRAVLPVRPLEQINSTTRFDLVLVPVRAEQVVSTLPLLANLGGNPDVLFFGNTAGRDDELTAALGQCTLFGFPAVGGFQDGPVVKYVLISQQQTMVGEPDGATTPRTLHLQEVFREAGFSTSISPDIGAWMLGHAAFVVPIAFALYRVDTDPRKLAAETASVRMMVRATRQAFKALLSEGNNEIPGNLRNLYLRMPSAFAVAYWRRVLAGQRGELWFGAHSRTAPEEMHAVAKQLQAAVHHTGRPTPDLDHLLSGV
jgi:2-dehydropantoate 2-reductase